MHFFFAGFRGFFEIKLCSLALLKLFQGGV